MEKEYDVKITEATFVEGFFFCLRITISIDFIINLLIAF